MSSISRLGARSIAGARLGAAVALVACLLLGCAARPRREVAPALAAPCRGGCVTPYGATLGRSPSGVVGYSNCSARCVSKQPHRRRGRYLGMRWQCVEYARRWLYVRHGVVYGDVDVAADIWDKVTHYRRVVDGAPIALDKHPNGGTVMPRVGDLLVYSRAYLGTGHVAVVVDVDLARRSVRVAEQNYRNTRWPGLYARELKLGARPGRAFVVDPHLLGWVRVAEALTPPASPGRPSR